MHSLCCRLSVVHAALPLPDPLPEEDAKKKQPQPEPETPPGILCGAFDRGGDRLALCDDHKQLTLWNCSKWTVERQWNLQRRANSVVFTSDGDVIVAGRKDLIKLYWTRSPTFLC